MRPKVAARKAAGKAGASTGLARADKGRVKPEPDRRADEGGGALGPDCPAVPLGVNDETLYLLDELCQLRKVPPKLDKSMLYSLFGHGWLDTRFPSFNQQGEVLPKKFNQDLPSARYCALMTAPASASPKCEGKGYAILVRMSHVAGTMTMMMVTPMLIHWGKERPV